MDWTRGMSQEFEYMVVDPGTWREKGRLDLIESCTVERDLEADTLGSASIDVTGDPGEVYVRVYLVATQDGATERFPLGTLLAQTPQTEFDGMRETASVDAYTPLIELKENKPPLGFYIAEGDDVMERVAELAAEHARAPVVPCEDGATMPYDFVANASDTWQGFLSDAAAMAGHRFDLDELGRICFAPSADRPTAPVWTFSEGNSSILRPAVTTERDMYGVPNVVEAVWSEDGDFIFSRAVNDDPNSATSTVARGREILHRDDSPDIAGIVTQKALDEYARRKLEELSAVECRVTYSHGYCPVRTGDCVRLDHPRAGLDGVLARVVSQSIDCSTSCQVEETAEFQVKYWEVP